MKKLLTLVFLLSSICAFSQLGFNYKALVKDGGGNILANQGVTVQFTILEGATQVNVYEETHTTTTDANGIVVLVIGTGTTTDEFFDIDWETYQNYLNVQIDSGVGLVDLGTTQFQLVPYALAAANSGVHIIGSGGVFGWRINGFPDENYGPIGQRGLDLSRNIVPSTTRGATGFFSTAIGNESTASGTSAMSLGDKSEASGEYAMSIGESSVASGKNSTSIGTDTNAESAYSTTIGRFNVGGGNPTQWQNADPLFEVGNGTSNSNRSNALTILKDGTIMAPSLDLGLITDDKALITKEYADLNLNSTGLEQLDEGNGLGWRLSDRNSNLFGDIGDGAIDLSSSSSVSSTKGATGGKSFALGENATAAGVYTVAMGNGATASGNQGIAIGSNVSALSYTEIALGRKNTSYTPSAPFSWNDSDRLLVLGNGDNSSFSDALIILKNGTITAPSFDLIEITNDKALITKEYADTNLTSSGLESLTESVNTGWRLKGADPANYGNIGDRAVDLSQQAFASSSKGARGQDSFATGFSTQASGQASTAMGWGSTATRDNAVAIGFSSQAFGKSSTAIGNSARAYSFSEVAIGANNTDNAANNLSGWDADDRIFSIGNGEDISNRSNALTVLKNGKVGIGEENPTAFLEISSVNNTNEPTLKLVHQGTTGARINLINTEVTNGNRWTLYGDPNDVDANSVFNIYHPNAGNIVRIHGDGELGINGVPNTDFHVYHGNSGTSSGMKLENNSSNDWWRFYISSSSKNLRLYSASQGTTIIGAFDDVSGAYTATSDRRLKKNFKDLHFNWKDFMRLKTLTYEYKAEKDGKKHIGLVAQDVKPIYPELVEYHSEEDVYHLNYSGFGVVAIKAIQEQQKLITDQASRIEELEAKVSEKELAINNMNKRLEAIERILIALE